MQQRVSIGRLMLAIVTLAVALTVCRAWSGPGNFGGFFGLATVFLLVVLAARMVTVGRVRRFCTGTALTAVVLGVLAFLAPEPILLTTVQKIVVPVEDLLPNGQGYLVSEEELLWAEVGIYFPEDPSFPSEPYSSMNWFRYRITYFKPIRDLQWKVLIPQVLLALLGGFLTIAFRSRATHDRMIDVG